MILLVVGEVLFDFAGFGSLLNGDGRGRLAAGLPIGR